MTYRNQMRDIYNDGSDITCSPTGDVTGKTFAAIAGPRTGGLLTIGTAPAGQRACGVIKYDATDGDLVGIARGSGRIVTVTAASTLNAGDEIEVGANGRATFHSDGVAAGYVVDDVDAGDDALVSLY